MLGDRQITANFVKYRLTISLMVYPMSKTFRMKDNAVIVLSFKRKEERFGHSEPLMYNYDQRHALVKKFTE